MSKQQPTPSKSAAALATAGQRPSRIRREPPPPEKPKSLRIYSAEHEGWVVVVGVILFALAIFVISLGVSEYTK